MRDFQKKGNASSVITVNKQLLNTFFKKYSNLQRYQSKVVSLYINRKYNSIWFDTDCNLIPLAHLIYAKSNSFHEEAVEACIDYQEIIDEIFNPNLTLSPISYDETEIMLTTLYVYYVQEVYDDFDFKRLQKIGWYLQKKEFDYNNFLNSVLQNPKLLDFDDKHQFSQYYKLRSALSKYSELEKRGEWNTIEYDSTVENYKPFDSSKTISQIRHRLFIMGDLDKDSKSAIYDEELMKAVLKFKKRNGYLSNYFISPWQIKQLNLPIQKYINQIKINMERCRWVDPMLTQEEEYIMINIPAFKLVYEKNGEKLLESNVFVGQQMMPTPVFSACMNSVVFSPYWYVPKSIIDNEIITAIKRDKNYLKSHNMEWNNGNVRQKPGPKNALGVVKFLFPNVENIYLHDTPAKLLFSLEYRAYSHGCVNLEKAKELAFLIFKDNPNWPTQCLNEAMQEGKEITVKLKKEIPIHLAYFTAWVDEQGVLHFYDDVYNKDSQIADLIVTN